MSMSWMLMPLPKSLQIFTCFFFYAKNCFPERFIYKFLFQTIVCSKKIFIKCFFHEFFSLIFFSWFFLSHENFLLGNLFLSLCKLIIEFRLHDDQPPKWRRWSTSFFMPFINMPIWCIDQQTFLAHWSTIIYWFFFTNHNVGHSFI